MDRWASGPSDIGFGGRAYRTAFEGFESSHGFFLASHPQGTIATGFDTGWGRLRLADAEIGVFSCVSSRAVTRHERTISQRSLPPSCEIPTQSEVFSDLTQFSALPRTFRSEICH
jgi:hypothetical protein